MISGILRLSLLACCLLTAGVAAADPQCQDAQECLKKGKEILQAADRDDSDDLELYDDDAFDQAENYLLTACSLSNAEACVLMGNHYGKQPGNGGDILDFEKAIAFYRMACELKDNNGCKQAIELYALSGEYCEYVSENGGYHPSDKCFNNAREYLENFCDAGNTSACESLGLIYENRYQPNDPEFEHVYEYLKKACDKNSAMACGELGRVYEKQNRDKPEMYEPLTLKSCALKNAFACCHLGELYLKGKHVPQDLKKALTFLEKACSLGEADGCSLLADIYEKGVTADAESTGKKGKKQNNSIKPNPRLAQKYRTRAEELMEEFY